MDANSIKGLGIVVIGKYKAIDPESLRGTSNLLYDPVKYRIADVSRLVNCIVSTGNWATSALSIPGTTATAGNATVMDFRPAWEGLLVNSINVHCQTMLTSEPANRISRGAILSGDSELAFIARHNIESEFSAIIEIANKTFFNRDYQTQVELLADSESEEWETLIFRFYLRVTLDELMRYQHELIEKFVSEIDPSKRTYFSFTMEIV